MTMPIPTVEPDHIDEPRLVQDFVAVLSKVAAEHKPMIVRRDGADLAAVVPLEYLELLREVLAQQRAEALLAKVDWDRLVKERPPPQQWFEGEEPKPF